jgi:predicted phage terminase large subunit-like protein
MRIPNKGARLTRLHREALSKSLLEFTRYTKPDYRDNWHHRELAARLDRVARGDCKRLMVFMPPQHGKSDILAVVRQRPLSAAFRRRLDRDLANPLAPRRPLGPEPEKDGGTRRRALGSSIAGGSARGGPGTGVRPEETRRGAVAGVQIGRGPRDHSPPGPAGFLGLVPAGPGSWRDDGMAGGALRNWIWTPAEHWPAPRKFRIRTVCVDASKGRSDKQGDYTAIVFVGVTNENLFYVDAIIERIPLDQIVRKTVLFCDQYNPNYVGIEAEQFQELLIPEFRRQCGDGLRWRSYGMQTHGVPKLARIRRLSQYVTNREFRFKADSPGCRLLVDQLMDFPLADHDDGPDALEMCMRLPCELCRPQEKVYSLPMSWFL